MKIYLAGRFSRRKELEGWGEQLIALGHTIVSRWSLRDTDHKLVDGLSPQAADHERLRFALEDCEDIRAITDERRGMAERQRTEQEAAAAKNKRSARIPRRH
jgi:hypothetical protein